MEVNSAIAIINGSVESVNSSEMSLAIVAVMGNVSRSVSTDKPQSHSTRSTHFEFLCQRSYMSSYWFLLCCRIRSLWRILIYYSIVSGFSIYALSIAFQFLILAYEKAFVRCAPCNNASRSCTLRFANYVVTFTGRSG